MMLWFSMVMFVGMISSGAFFDSCRWACRVTQPVQRTLLWPASWLPAIDKGRGSKLVDVQRVWEVSDEGLQFMSQLDAGAKCPARRCFGAKVQINWADSKNSGQFVSLTVGWGGLIFGRRRVSPAVIDARRNLSGVCGRWYPFILDLHRFFVATARAVVNHDGLGGTAPDPLVWSAGAPRRRRRLAHAVRDRAFLPGPPGIWHSDWFQVPAAAICAEDVALWSYTPSLLVKWVSFLSSLHWPVGDLDLGVGGVSYVELLILYELWAGERLFLEKALTLVIFVQGVQFQCRLFLLDQALIFGAPVVLLVP